MLVLSRKALEQIRIGDHITVTVIRIGNNSVRLGIDAPREVRALRGELEAFLGSEDPAGELGILLPNTPTDLTTARHCSK